MTTISVRRILSLLAICLIFTATANGAVTGNLIVNPGGELGQSPWSVQGILRDSPLTLPNGVAILASEGTHFFGRDDILVSSVMGEVNSINQTIDVRPYPSITSIEVGMDVMVAGLTLLGDGQPAYQPYIFFYYEDASHNFIDASPLYDFDTVTIQSGTAIGFPDLRATVTPLFPSGTAFIVAKFWISSQMRDATVNSQVRILTGIDDTFLSITYNSADFNNNGIVDAADYVVWRTSNGTAENYNLWRSRFGQAAASGSSIGAADNLGAVPEPAGLLLICLAVASLPRVRLRFAYERSKLSNRW